MKFSEQWLREWVNPNLGAHELGAQLTMAGLEVESIIPVANAFRGVVVGEVISVIPHPNADRLRVCEVNVGKETLTIVCGAANVRVGMKVPVALIDAVLAANLIIKKTKLRGVESSGMLCSATELGLAETSEGLLELPKDAPVGEDLRRYLQLEDHIFELKITPNRGDCLSIAGLAREVSVLNQCALTPHKYKNIVATISDAFPIKNSASTACPAYSGRIIKNVDITRASPLWLQERLRRSGIRSINPVVDITNYVMLEIGQPLHAFDLEKLNSNIQIRFAKPQEKISLLNEQEIQLDEKTLVIADAQQAVALAGIMGGKDSAINTTTKNIFLEGAFFASTVITQAVQKYFLSSDSAQRFERGVDPNLQNQALERATELILTICGGQPGPIHSLVESENLPKPTTIQLRKAQIKRILGIEISDQQVKKILTDLNMQVQNESYGWQVIPPSYRFDMHLEVDLIEELARIYGYNNIPNHLPTAILHAPNVSETQINISRIRQLLMDKGFREAITYSFVAPTLQSLFDPKQTPKPLTNPISAELSVMRTNLWAGLVQAALYNLNRQEARIALFETGLCFTQQDKKLLQLPKLGGVWSGTVYPEQWGVKNKTVDFFDCKNIIENILLLGNNLDASTFKLGGHPALHPAKSVTIYQNEKCIGYLGELHPSIAQQLDLTTPLYLFELDLNAIQNSKLPAYMPISKFPAVRRDLAIIIPESLILEDVKQKILQTANQLLKNVQIFDIYQGKGIAAGYKSVALSLLFQHQSQTLTDEDINAQMQQIIQALTNEFQAKLRE